jgi:hypothetical protein
VVGREGERAGIDQTVGLIGKHRGREGAGIDLVDEAAVVRDEEMPVLELRGRRSGQARDAEKSRDPEAHGSSSI